MLQRRLSLVEGWPRLRACHSIVNDNTVPVVLTLCFSSGVLTECLTEPASSRARNDTCQPETSRVVFIGDAFVRARFINVHTVVIAYLHHGALALR